MILHADARHLPLKDGCVQTVVTSPPYWNQRDYHVTGQIGLESTVEAYVQAILEVSQELWRVLKPDATLWLNLGDSFAGLLKGWTQTGQVGGAKQQTNAGSVGLMAKPSQTPGFKPKDLLGIPWRVAFALQAAGWYLRADIIWVKPNPMCESVQDRPTRSHEYVFLFSKQRRYFYDAEAIKVPGSMSSLARMEQPSFDQQAGGEKDAKSGNRSCRKALVNLREKQRGHRRRHNGFNDRWDLMSKEEPCSMRVNKRDVWVIALEPFPGPHFATFPQKLVEPCILAGSCPGDLVLDPFGGSGTVALVAQRFGRRAVSLDLSAAYCRMAKERLAGHPLALPLIPCSSPVS